MKASELAKVIEHTALKPDVTERDIEQLCSEAVKYGFFGVCVGQHWVPRAINLLKGSLAKTVTVVGFPHGNSCTKGKVCEATATLADGAAEVDMVINIGALKSGNDRAVARDIEAVGLAVHQKKGAVLKVIIETALLTREEKIRACQLSEKSGADFVKTSTGFASAGATVEDVQLMKATIGKTMRIKAAGGIRDYATAISLIQAGADRLGCSASVSILKGADS